MNGVILILAHGIDTGAAAVAAALRGLISQHEGGNASARSTSDVTTTGERVGIKQSDATEVWLVRPEVLCMARWSHTVDAFGKTTSRLSLPGKPAFGEEQIKAVLNRLHDLPAPQFAKSNPKDRDYAASEFQALIISWLAACEKRIGKITNSIRANPCLHPTLPAMHWKALAARYGIPLAKCSVAHPLTADVAWDASVLIAGKHTSGLLAEQYGAVCRAICKELGFELLEFRFQRQWHQFVLVDVCHLPALHGYTDTAAVAQCLYENAFRQADQTALEGATR